MTVGTRRSKSVSGRRVFSVHASLGCENPNQAYQRTKKTSLPRENSRSLHCAPPDFLWRVVALINTVRLSLRRAAYVAVASSAKQEIRVRSGRDDNSVEAGIDATGH